MKNKPIQYFNKEYVERVRDLTPDQILQFLEDYQTLMAQLPEKCQLISLKIEPSLLNAFKFKAKGLGIPYQTQIKKLMREWVKSMKDTVEFVGDITQPIEEEWDANS